jgi:hypothetical protein
MQIIKLTETTAAQIEVPFTSVLASNLQSRILGSTLANTSISVYAKRGGTGAAVALTSDGTTWTATDDTNAPGVRGYKPKAAELVAGFQTLVFTGTNMEPREVPIMVVTADPFDLATGAAQTTLASAVAALPSAATIATAVLAATIHTGWSVARALRIIAGGVAGKLTGSTFRYVDDSGDAITGTSDTDGNRTAATYGA